MLICLLPLLILLLSASNSIAAELPAIIAGGENTVPACVEPAKLMKFVEKRNVTQNPSQQLDSRFAGIAHLYQKFGSCVAREPEKCVGVRWDYAFYQMLIETNYLTFRRPDGVPAAVSARDNNFAGLGATKPGHPGERFKDVTSGVLAHLQHVLMYSTTRIPNPTAERTRKVQNDVQAIMRKLHRPVTFADLAQEWTGTNKNSYGRDMLRIADKYARTYCGERKVAAR